MAKAEKIFFHACKAPKNGRINKNRTHTLCMKSQDGNLFITWAKPWSGGYDIKSGKIVKPDFYSKKEGVRISNEKMDRFIKTPPRNNHFFIDQNKELVKKKLFDILPSCVASTLSWYISSAIRYFNLDKTAIIIAEGTGISDNGDIVRSSIEIPYTLLIENNGE